MKNNAHHDALIRARKQASRMGASRIFNICFSILTGNPKLNMSFTKKQGQYLVFIYYYQKLNKVAPAHADFQKYFVANPASVNDMLKNLERKGFITKKEGRLEVFAYLYAKKIYLN